ncbi:hypothetical protein [Helicobacter rodentium]|nr:hypothetical protein [Helicobacter rodentium]
MQWNLKEVQYYRFVLKRVKMLRICTPRKFFKFSRNDENHCVIARL